MHRSVWVALLLLCLGAGVPAIAQTPPRLEVGLRDDFILVPDKNAKRVTGWMIVRAGCADEFDGDCRGIAHYLEHLLFINRDAEQKSKVTVFPGGSGNGVTTQITTYYTQSFPADAATDAANIDTLMAYFAGLLVDVRATEDQAARERNVVRQEIDQRYGRNPLARFHFSRSGVLMPGDPLGLYTGNTTDGVNAFTMGDAKAFHKIWYHKSNSVLVLHGPLAAETVQALADKHFGPLPAGTTPPHPWHKPRTFKPDTVRIDETDADVRETTVLLDRLVAYDEPVGDARARLVAARSMAGAYTASRIGGSPMDALLERDGLVTQGGLSFSKLRDGLLRVTFYGVPTEGVTADQLVSAMRAQLALLAERGVSPEVVERLKTRHRVGRALMREEPERYANALVGWLTGHNTLSSWHDIDTNVPQVTSADVNMVLKSLSAPGREVVAVMAPKARSVGDQPASAKD